MKKIVVLLLVSMISSLGVFAKLPKNKVKKVATVAGCNVYPITQGHVQVGDKMICTDLNGKVTVITTMYNHP